MTDRNEIQREIEEGLSAMRREVGLESAVVGYLTVIFVLTVFAFTLVAAVVAEKLG